MAKLEILRYPDPRLHTKAQCITHIDDMIRHLAADMAETMYAAPGIGLAATQVDRHVQLITMDVSEDKSQLRILINPEIIARHGLCEGEEGCLSVPGIYETVQRSETVSVRAMNLDGELVVLHADGLLAICIQHEIDHLHGRVFVDYLSRLKQTRIKTRLSKHARVIA